MSVAPLCDDPSYDIELEREIQSTLYLQTLNEAILQSLLRKKSKIETELGSVYEGIKSHTTSSTASKEKDVSASRGSKSSALNVHDHVDENATTHAPMAILKKQNTVQKLAENLSHVVTSRNTKHIDQKKKSLQKDATVVALQRV
jgi:hypothetical protein